MAIIKEDFVSFETAKLLKEKGCPDFGYSCICDSEGNKAQIQSIIMKWLREVYNIIVEPESVWNGEKWEYLLFIVTPQNADSPYYEHNPYKSYEECVEAGIKYCLENLI